MKRNAQKLEDFAGLGQVGGSSDAISLVLAIVLLCQVRHHQGIATSTLLAILDLKWAFDLANIDGMLFSCPLASIEGLDWLLVDDILRMDHQVLELHGILTAVFALGVGTAPSLRMPLRFSGQLLT